MLTDRNALAREAMATQGTLPQVEEEDYRLIVPALADRLRASLDDELDNLPPDAQPPKAERAPFA